MREWLDIVDKEDKVIGKAPKDDIYARNCLHRIVHIFVFNEKGEMAIQMRSATKSFAPNCWTTGAAGHVCANEGPKLAAERELEEEIGLKTPIEYKAKIYYQDTPDRPSKFLYCYETRSEGPFTCDPAEVDFCRFFSFEKIQDMVKRGEGFHPEFIFLLKEIYGIGKS